MPSHPTPCLHPLCPSHPIDVTSSVRPTLSISPPLPVPPYRCRPLSTPLSARPGRVRLHHFPHPSLRPGLWCVRFLKLAPKLARIRGEVDRGACKAAFENQRAMTFPQLAKGLGAVEVVGEASDGTKNSALPIDFGTSTNIDVTIKEEEGTRMRQRAQAVRELDDAAPTKEGPIRSNDTSPWSFLQATPIVGVLFAPSTTPVDHGLPAPSTTGGRPGQAKGEATKGWF